MRARVQNIRLIKIAMAAALIFPAGLFAVTAIGTYRSIHALADERLTRSLDVQQEEVGNAFELVRLVLDNATEAVAEMSVDDIRHNEPALHARLKKQVDSVGVVQSIWIYGLDGRTLVNSWTLPSPTADFSDRDFVKAHIGSDVGIHVGQVYSSSLGAQPFFTISRRLVRDETPVGIVEISILPSSFFRFFSALAYAKGLQYALVRADGVFLARYPAAPHEADRLGPETGFARTVAGSPQGGAYSVTSPIDSVDRRYIIRKLPEWPVYLTAGVDNASLRHEWLQTMGTHLVFGLPATLALFLTLWAILQRTKRLYAEIDGRTAAEEALRQSQKLEAIGHLTGGIAHDFNNLLTIIIGNLEAALRQPDDSAKLKRRIDNAMHGANRAATLTKRLLAFSRQQPLMPKPIDVNRLLNGMSDFLHRSLGEHIALEVVGGAGVWPVEADPAELESALLNLAVNARDAMAGGGKLTIEAGNSWLDDAYCEAHAGLRPGQYVLISVTDTGAGMSKEVIERAFEPFFTTKQSGHGTGLGLSQVYGFVKQSGGHVRIYSEVGEGTTINVYLPRYHGDAEAPDTAPVLAGQKGGAEHILIVEDDADVRAYVAETLSSLGYRVSTARSGPEALRLLETLPDKPQLLLTDVVMPGMNGRHLADAASEFHPALKVVYMTGYSRNAIVHQGRLDAGVDLLQKPLSSEQLAKMVRAVLDR
jgi:two-component system NtrC family sensor kinase